MKSESGMRSSLPMVRDSGILLKPDSRRVLLRPFKPADQKHIARIVSSVLALDEERAQQELNAILTRFSRRHNYFDDLLERRFKSVSAHIALNTAPSQIKKYLIGACFVGEYSYESSALFNPSIVPHPDQSGVSTGGLRFILSLRATGEGHVSSLTFGSGLVDPRGNIAIDRTSEFAAAARVKPDALYDKGCFVQKLQELGLANDCSKAVTEPLADQFTMADLKEKIKTRLAEDPARTPDKLTCDRILWLAQCNYEAFFSPQMRLSERVLFPLSPSEENGIEDARFVLFTDDDGSKKYYATYTAYDGKNILPQIMETPDFLYFKMITLNGRGAADKGMALFPRKINGHYAMVSRIDGENLFLMYSDNIHFWYDAVPLMQPLHPWELLKIGNCGSPIETEHGWILLTHGVGPLRQYSIGAALLDREDPSRVLGRLSEPLICWKDSGSAAYVPNVVYSCGALLHGRNLIIPYASLDYQTHIAQVPLDDLVAQIMASPKPAAG